MNLREYNVWITVKENGRIHVYEEFHWKGDPYDNYSVFIRFHIHPDVKINTEKIIQSECSAYS